MPTILDYSSAQNNIELEDFGYQYPDGLDLKPGSQIHRKIVGEVIRRARESAGIMASRHPSWRSIDRNLTAYISPESEHAKVENKLSPVIIPLSYATLETLLTYLVKAFLDDPIFRYEGMGPEDTIGAILLEQVVNSHCQHNKVGLNIHTFWRDALAYGFGVVAATWRKEWGWTTRKEVRGQQTAMGFIPTEEVIVKEEGVKYEGNALMNIDPYRYLPDPNVPVHDVQSGDFAGWIDRTSVMALLEQERDGSVFNAKYLKGKGDCRSSIASEAHSGRDRFGLHDQRITSTQACDVIHMYVKVIPKEWKLGDSEYPEIWKFAVAGDNVVIEAQPLNLDHNRYPIAVCAPDTDGYAISPVSRLEVVYGLQEVADFLFTSHISNVKKALNDMLLVDPSQVNMEDLLDPRPGKIIRMRRSAWGKGVNDAIKQLNVSDITGGHISDASVIADLIQRTTGATDILQGVQKSKSGERRSSAEFSGTTQMALSRLEKIARIGGLQGMQDVGYLFGCHTQQLMSGPLWVKTLGRWTDNLQAEFGDVDRIKADPSALNVAFDILPHDGTTAGIGNADGWTQLYQMAIQSQNPEILGRLDMVKVFLHIARQLGCKNTQEFMRAVPSMSGAGVQVMPDAQVGQQVQSGNLVPMGGQ